MPAVTPPGGFLNAEQAQSWKLHTAKKENRVLESPCNTISLCNVINRGRTGPYEKRPEDTAMRHHATGVAVTYRIARGESEGRCEG